MKIFLINKKNKKGNVFSMWWFVMAVLVAAVIYIMVNMFFQSPIDIRDLEVNSLINHVADCIYYAGQFNNNINFLPKNSLRKEDTTLENNPVSNEVEVDKEFLIKNCNLNLYDENYPKENQYFIQVNIYELKTASNSLDYKDNLLVSSIAGNEIFKDYCDLQLQKNFYPSANALEEVKYEDNTYKTLPFCKNKKFYAFTRQIMSDNSRKEYIVEIIGGIKKLNENVKV
ncbi:hypothetical protein GYA25_03170 [Candidatus Woesearchaeota archaeon]|nr:hypothetical protein [Candidatus Woesearchaeota archaeon]